MQRLFLPASEGRVEIVNFLLGEAGLDLSIHRSSLVRFSALAAVSLAPADRYGLTPLDDAIRWNHDFFSLL